MAMHGCQCGPLWVMQLFCHPKYSILYGALMSRLVVVKSDGSSLVTGVTFLMLFVGSC